MCYRVDWLANDFTTNYCHRIRKSPVKAPTGVIEVKDWEFVQEAVHASALPSIRKGLAQGHKWLVQMQGAHLSPTHHLHPTKAQDVDDSNRFDVDWFTNDEPAECKCAVEIQFMFSFFHALEPSSTKVPYSKVLSVVTTTIPLPSMAMMLSRLSGVQIST